MTAGNGGNVRNDGGAGAAGAGGHFTPNAPEKQAIGLGAEDRAEAGRLSGMSEMTFGGSSPRQARAAAAAIFEVGGLEWSPDLVKHRLRMAARLIERCVQNPRPSGLKSSMPKPDEEWSPRVVDHAAILAELERKSDRQLLGSYTDQDISKAEQAIGWPARYLGASICDEERAALSLWLWCAARNQPWERHCAALGCVKRTANRRRARAFEIVCAGLMRDGVKP